MQSCTSLQCHYLKPYVYVCVCAFSCDLPPALLADHLGSFTCYCGKTWVETDTEIRVSTESCLASKPFDNESVALQLSCTDLRDMDMTWGEGPSLPLQLPTTTPAISSCPPRLSTGLRPVHQRHVPLQCIMLLFPLTRQIEIHIMIYSRNANISTVQLIGFFGLMSAK